MLARRHQAEGAPVAITYPPALLGPHDPKLGDQTARQRDALSTRNNLRTLRAVTGRALPALHLPARAMLPVGLLAGLVQQAWPWHIPAEYGHLPDRACGRLAARAVRAVPTG